MTGTYAILKVSASKLVAVKSGLDSTGSLVGTAWDGTNYYIATGSKGIFSDVDSYATALYSGAASTASRAFNGMIAVGSDIVAVGRNENLLIKKSGSTNFDIATFSNNLFTGALAVYEAGTDDILLLGVDIDGETYTFGYREMVLPGGALPPGSPTLKKPGEGSPTTVTDTAQYASSLGKKPVTNLHQFDATGKNLLFASTWKDGLWSYRGGEWNAEE
ncbi:hypothetical protein MASR2M78_04090 [Treponema sp.]